MKHRKHATIRSLSVCTLLLIVACFSFLCSSCKKKHPPPPSIEIIETKNQETIKVLLFNDVNSVRVSAEDSFDVWGANSLDGKLTFETENELTISLRNNVVHIGSWQIEPQQLHIECKTQNKIRVNGDDYRGMLKIIYDNNSRLFDVINLVPVESYLAGVVGAEMPSYWELEALKAQTIAARTYCLFIKYKYGTKRNWDIQKTQAHQVYKGIAAENAQVWKAIRKTTGQVLQWNNPEAKNDKDRLFPAFYSSVCGGHTEKSRNTFGGFDYPSLQGVKCKYCEKIAKPAFFEWPTVQISKATLQQRLVDSYPSLAKLERIEKIKIKRQSEYDDFNRPTLIELEGSNGERDVVRAEDFRLALDPTGMRIRSPAFVLQTNGSHVFIQNGRGFGHGVGLCQCGSQGMARKEMSAEKILDHYYPKSTIEKIY